MNLVRRPRLAWVVLSAVLAPALFTSRCEAQGKADIDLSPITEKHVMIPMRDGKRLSAYLYIPPGKGPWPVVFEQRYADIRGAATRKGAAKLAIEGFVVALVNFRGTHQSEGDWVGYRALGWGKLKDGYDVCEWLGTQPWSTGKVATFGSSQGGFAQNFLAVTQPPHLVCQYMEDTGLSLFQEGYRIGGVTRPERFKSMAQVCREPKDNARLMAEWFRHPNYDDYWRDEDCTLHFAKMNVPCFTLGSWYDFMNQGSIASFQGRQHQGGVNSRGRQQLIIGPWLHGRGNRTNRIAEMVYPENATWPQHEHMVRWFKHYLCGEDNGVEKEPTVRYYVMGAVGEKDAPGNVWRTAKDWPPPHTMTPLYLQAEGKLSTKAPTEESGSTSYRSDPLKPMSIPGAGFPGAKDARSFEQQAEVRTFTTPPLTEAVEWTGRVKAELYFSSTARDTDVLVRVSDVYPDGKSILIIDYPQRLRYREGFDREVLLEPGKVAKVAFDVGWISQVFNKGHRIRVTIASTGAPLYEPNPQTGGPQTIEFPKDAVAATNTVHHNRVHASRILAPIPVAAKSSAGSGSTKLFASGDLAGWVEEQHNFFKKKHPRASTWSVKEGVVYCDGTLGNCGFLRYEKKLTDFTLRLEYRMSKKCNSGVCFRTRVPYNGVPDETLPSRTGFEVQIQDDAGEPASKTCTGAFYGQVAPRVNAANPAGEWNALEIACQGPRIRVVLNGEVIHELVQTKVDAIKDRPLSGYIALQNHGHDIEFRNLRLEQP